MESTMAWEWEWLVRSRGVVVTTNGEPKAIDDNATHALARRDWGAWLAAWLTYDFASKYDKYWIDRIKHPATLLGLAALTAAVCGAYLHAQGYLVAIVLGTALSLGLVWPWVSIRGLTGTVEFDQTRVVEGEPVTVTARVRNRSPLAVWGVSAQEGLGRSPEAPPLASLAFLGALSQREATWIWRPERRGEFPDPEGTDPVRLSTGFPFGLWNAGRALSCVRPIVVWPRPAHVGVDPHVGEVEDVRSLSPTNKVGTTGDVLGVRPYRRGDPLRRIHWAQTARVGGLIVCEVQAQALPRLRVVLDADPQTHRGSGPQSSREWAIRIAAGLIDQAIARGAVVEAVLGGWAIPSRGGEAQRRLIMDALAKLPETDQPSLTEVLEALRWGGQGRNPGDATAATVIVTTDHAWLDSRPQAVAARDHLTRVEAETTVLALRAETFEAGADWSPAARARLADVVFSSSPTGHGPRARLIPAWELIEAREDWAASPSPASMAVVLEQPEPGRGRESISPGRRRRAMDAEPVGNQV